MVFCTKLERIYKISGAMIKMILLILPLLLLSGGKIHLPVHGTDTEKKEILFEKVYLHV
jgi:hypothetical protein